MSIRPPEESLVKSLSQIRSGIDTFSQAVDCRQRNHSDPFLQSHLDEIHGFRMKLLELLPELERLRRENW